jgi:MFS family permease
MAAVSPLTWNPISNIYERQPIYIMSLVTAVLFSALSGWCKSYHVLLAMRALTGLFSDVSLGLGNATVTDLFFEHERGRYMGVYTLGFIMGGHVAPIIGGYINKRLSWRWCFFLPSTIAAGLLVLFCLTVP